MEAREKKAFPVRMTIIETRFWQDIFTFLLTFIVTKNNLNIKRVLPAGVISVMLEWLNISLATIVALLPITNPVSTAALFMSITAGIDKKERQNQAYKAAVYAC